jgi:hypothetical protein
VRVTAVTGGLVWLGAPWLPVGERMSIGALDHSFLFFPLVVAPLVLALAASVLQPQGAARRLYRLGQRVQPFASASVFASFLVPHGALAGALVLPWTAMAVVLAIAGIPTALRGARPHLSRANLLVAHVLLPVATGWLVAARVGAAPASIGSLGVFLACLHFHFSGFTLQILVAATATRLPAMPRLAAIHRVVAIGAIVALPLISAGKLVPAPVLLTLGVAIIVIATVALAALGLAIAFVTPVAFARRLLFVSAGSVAAAMVLAALFRVGEHTGIALIGVDRMIVTHGLANALGFVGCGLLAHLRLAAARTS